MELSNVYLSFSLSPPYISCMYGLCDLWVHHVHPNFDQKKPRDHVPFGRLRKQGETPFYMWCDELNNNVWWLSYYLYDLIILFFPRSHVTHGAILMILSLTSAITIVILIPQLLEKRLTTYHIGTYSFHIYSHILYTPSYPVQLLHFSFSPSFMVALKSESDSNLPHQYSMVSNKSV